MNSLMLRLFYLVLIALTYRVTIACDVVDPFVCTTGRYGRCIDKFDLCDGIDDCSNGEDETIGCELFYNCTPPSKFLCKDKKCIPRMFHCDGNKDCGDGSDEIDCTDERGVTRHCVMSRGNFLCANDLECIGVNQLCDKKDDCLDGSDEGGLCLEEPLSECNCHSCIRTPKEDLCTCDEGYTPVNNSCEDVDECSLPHICDHHCTNTPGSYRCSCAPHYILQPNGRSCMKEPQKNQNESIAFLYTTEESHLYALVAPNFTKFPIKIPTTLEVDHVTSLLEDTWRFDTLDEITFLEVYLRNKNNSKPDSVPIVFPFKSLCPHIIQTASDFGTMNIYIACNTGAIVACRFSLFSCIVVRPAKNNIIKRIALSPLHGLMFWIERNTTSGVGSIMRSSMSGTNNDEKVIVQGYFGSDNLNLAIDSASRRVFFFNPRKKHIESINFDGTGQQVVQSDISEPSALGVYKEEIFWGTETSFLLFACDKHSGKNTHIVVEEEASINSLIPNHPALTETPCSEWRCSDICLLTSEETKNGPVARPTCACFYSANTSLSADNITCPYTTVLASNVISGNKNHLFVIGSIFDLMPKVKKIELDDINEVSCMTYDPVQANVFLFDSKEKILYAFNLKTRNLTVFSTNVGTINSIAYDGRSNNLYFINEDTETIEALSLKTKRKATLVGKRAGERMTAFSLDLKAGVICIALSKTINGTHTNGTYFVFASLNDTAKQKVVFYSSENAFEGPIRHLVVDENTKLMWFFRTRDSFIETLKYDQFIINGKRDNRTYSKRAMSNRITDLAVESGKAFFTMQSSKEIGWYSLDDTPESRLYDVVAEENGTVDPFHLKIAPVTGLVNTSSPCFRNNGDCDHVCLIVNTKTYSKRCLCEEGYSLADDGLHCHQVGLAGKMNSMEASSHHGARTSLFILFVFIMMGAFFFLIYYRTDLGLHRRYRFILACKNFRQIWGGSESNASSNVSQDVEYDRIQI